MKKLNFALFVIIGSIVIAWCETNKPTEEKDEIANPASVFCEENWWILEIVSDESWDRWKCIFENWNWCEKWSYYNWECDENSVINDEISDNWQSSTVWKLMAFNGKEVEWNYNMTIDENGQMWATFCNSMWWIVIFDWDDISGTIKTVDGIARNEMRCEWESMEIEDAFDIEWSKYQISNNEYGFKTLTFATHKWNVFNWIESEFNTWVIEE